MKKLISYVTVCLNSEKYIRQCLESIISQKTEEIEYIVIDGGSTDKTIEIIEDYKDKIDYFETKKDNGMYFAMNDSISHANGDYICFINSDDWLEDSTVQKITFEFKNLEQFDIFYGDQNIFLENKKLYKSKTNHNFLKNYMSIAHQSAYVKRNLYDMNLYDTNFSISADYDLFLKFKSMNKTFKKIEGILSNFRLNGISSNKEISSKEFFIIQKKYNSFPISLINYFIRYRNLNFLKY